MIKLVPDVLHDSRIVKFLDPTPVLARPLLRKRCFFGLCLAP
jgi:hypothetical protein